MKKETAVTIHSTRITSAKSAESHLRRVMSWEQEEFWLLSLSLSLHLVGSHRVFLGTVDRCIVHPREVFKKAILDRASQLIIAHGHPYGGPAPSQDDRLITKRLVRCGKLLGIPIVDHLILSPEGMASFSEMGWEPFQTDDN